MVNKVKELTDRLSDINTWQSEFSFSSDADNEGDNNTKKEAWKTMNERQRSRRNKRRNSLTPNKEFFMKKKNLRDSC